MASSNMPTYPKTPASPFDFPAELLKKILEHYYRNETLIISKPHTRPFTHYHFNIRDHSKGPLAKYKRYFVRTERSILNITSTSRRLRFLALEYLTKHVYFDLRVKAETKYFLKYFQPTFRRQVQHVVTRASYTDNWAQKLFQERWPALKTLTIYEDWDNEGVGRDKFSLELGAARFWNGEVETWQYAKEAQLIIDYVKKAENEHLVVDSRASADEVDAMVRNIAYHRWKSMQRVLATKKKRSFDVEFVLYINEGVDAVLKVEDAARSVLLVVGMPCERQDMMRLEYFECAGGL